MKNQSQENSKLCTKCGLIKPLKDFRKQRSACRACERDNDHQRCSGARACTNCHLFKLESEFDKFSRHCKECKSLKGKNKLIGLRNDPDQSRYELHLERNPKNNLKRYRKRYDKFDTTPIEECYVEFLNVLRKNANSRATKKQIAYDADLLFLIDLYNKQDGKCALTGLPFNLDRRGGTKRVFAPSIDRLDCKGGYTKDNVRLVCLIVNIALNDFGDYAFDIMCRGYVKHQTKS